MKHAKFVINYSSIYIFFISYLELMYFFYLVNNYHLVKKIQFNLRLELNRK